MVHKLNVIRKGAAAMRPLAVITAETCCCCCCCCEEVGDDEESDSGSDDDDSGKSGREPADGLSPSTVGDEDEIEAHQALDDDDSVKPIPDDFYYNYDEHVSKAAVSDESGLPPNLLTL